MERNVEGYHFTCDEDAKMAMEELKKINLISGKLNANNPKAVLLVYNKCIQSNMFITPLGIDYLKSLQTYLKNNPDINSDEVYDIPIRISYNDAIMLKSNNRFKDIDKKPPKSYVKEFTVSVLMNVALVIVIIGMFVMALTATNPNILNYKNTIVNQYSEWDQNLTKKENELKEREKAIKKMEMDLGISGTGVISD